MARYAVVEGGVVVNMIEARSPEDVPSLTLVAAPDEPKVGIGWMWNGANWLMPPRWPSVAAGRAELRGRVNAERDAHEQGGFAYMGKVIDSDPLSAQRLIGAAQLAQIAIGAAQPFSIDWTCADDTSLTMDAQQMLGAMAALGQHVTAVHARARQLKAQLEAAQTVAELEQVEAQIAEGWA